MSAPTNCILLHAFLCLTSYYRSAFGSRFGTLIVWEVGMFEILCVPPFFLLSPSLLSPSLQSTRALLLADEVRSASWNVDTNSPNSSSGWRGGWSAVGVFAWNSPLTLFSWPSSFLSSLLSSLLKCSKSKADFGADFEAKRNVRSIAELLFLISLSLSLPFSRIVDFHVLLTVYLTDSLALLANDFFFVPPSSTGPDLVLSSG
jgi:hypothetical protein